MADETTTSGGGEDQLVAAIAKAAGGKITGTTEAPEQTTEAEDKEAVTEDKETVADENAQEEVTEKEPEAKGEQSNPEEIVQKGVLKLKELPENEGKSEEELRGLLKENAERSLNTDNEGGTDVSAPSLNEEIKSKTNGQFESLDAIIEAAKNIEPTFANDQIKHLNDLASKGVDVEQVLSFGRLKVGDLDPSNIEEAKKLVKLELKLNEPDITDKELDYELKQLYTLTEELDEMDEVTNTEAIEHAKLRLQRNAKKAKQTLLTKQKELEIPSIGIAGQTAEQKELAEKQVKEWQTKVDSSLASFETLEIPVGKDQSFKYKIAGESKETIKNTMTNPDKFLLRYVEDGQANMEKFRRDMTIIENFDTIAKALFSQGDSAGAERVLNSITNPSTDSTGVGQKPVTKSAGGQVADAFKSGQI